MTKLTIKERAEEKHRQDTLKILAKYVRVDFGKECKDFEEGCCICDAYKALRNLQRLYGKETN